MSCSHGDISPAPSRKMSLTFRDGHWVATWRGEGEGALCVTPKDPLTWQVGGRGGEVGGGEGPCPLVHSEPHLQRKTLARRKRPCGGLESLGH